ncbi:4-coumarate ligase [Fusarium tjaetaba]|uniref:4-coumarate ligase n=1 Tax=Fusarium tjaetaba TaxID=1567544 RepID=A0A8H5RJH8_9HYPO|nr:4-coumarate ligase [Fusarium tjaetaba]KAF5636700.1 4-coumarate ligase [Fusarium tjaetaba]
MPIQSRWTTPTPRISLPGWVFGSEQHGLRNEKIAFVDADDPSNTLTIWEFELYSKRLAVGLQRLGVTSGDRVLVFSENGIFVPCLFFGIIMAGAIYTGATSSSTALELSYQLKDSGAKVLITSTNLIGTAVESAQIVGLEKSHIFHQNARSPHCKNRPHGSVHSWTELFGPDHEAESFQWFEPPNPETAICCLNSSSGTTGRPKGVEVTHFAYVANGEAHLLLHRLQKEAWSGPYRTRALCFLPLNHAAAQTTFIANYPKMGVETYIMGQYNFNDMLSHIEKYQITELMTAPPIISSLVANSVLVDDSLRSVKNVICGTAPLALSLEQRANTLFKVDGVIIRQGWGMTELTCLGTMNDPRLPGSPGSVGEIAPNSAIKLMHGETEITEANKQGELWFTSPTLMAGYWKNPGATGETVIDKNGIRWLKTGDIAYVDSWGPGANIYLVDRSKEILKVKGFQVAPAELEATLVTHPDIIDSAVIGTDIQGHEVPRAYVVRRPGSCLTSHDIMSWMESKVASHKRLDGGIVFVDGIPRTQSGKILRRILRERAKKETKVFIPMKAKLA